jgi:hypothetical protein
MDRSTILVPLALRVEHARQRLVALGITDPEHALRAYVRGE